MTANCAVLGSGNIGTDLMYKLVRSPSLDVVAVVGNDPDSEGLARARRAGIDASPEGIEWILARADDIEVVFDATSARAHVAHAPRLADAGIRSIDLTPAKLGPAVVPVVNLSAHLDAADVSLLTCGAQATIPVVAAVARVTDVSYAEIVATISSSSAGPGTRQNIDEFTRSTARGLEDVGGARAGKAIIILNPADPPILMRNTVFCALPPSVDESAIAASIADMADEVRAYVPGYRVRGEPVFDTGRVAVFLEVEGAADYLPAYAGNLDIMTSAALRVAEALARAVPAVGITP